VFCSHSRRQRYDPFFGLAKIHFILIESGFNGTFSTIRLYRALLHFIDPQRIKGIRYNEAVTWFWAAVIQWQYNKNSKWDFARTTLGLITPLPAQGLNLFIH